MRRQHRDGTTDRVIYDIDRRFIEVLDDKRMKMLDLGRQRNCLHWRRPVNAIAQQVQ